MSGKRGGRGKALGPAPLPADSLVSFSLPSRRADGGPPARPRHRHHVEHHSEEEYLRAKNVFVLAPTPSLAARFPDDSIPWSSVFEIVVPSSQPDAVTCPICIEPPKVPRITQCGHVLCYACIARLLQPGVAKCPICSKIVHEADLRRARIRDLGRNSVSALLSNSLDGTKPAADDCFWLPQSVVKHTKQLEEVCIPGRRRVVRFKLRHARVDAGAFIPPYVDDFDAEFAPQVLATQSYVHSRILDDISVMTSYLEEVQQEIKAHTDIVSSGPVIKSSDAGPAKPTAPLSYASIASSRSASTPPLMSSTPPIRLQDVMDADDALLVHRTVIEDDLTWAAVASACISTLRDELACFVEETPATPRPMISAFECGCAERPVAGSTMDPCRCGAAYVWYQSECGEPAYLDPLTMRILLASVNGKHDALPRVVDATVAQIQVGTLTEALRSKHVFLRLLPRLVRFFLVEMDTWKTAYHPPPGSSLSDVCAKHAQQRRHFLQQHSKSHQRAVVSAAVPPPARTYEEQYAAVMGGAMPSVRYSSQTDTDVLPMHGQLESFPALPADAAPAALTAAVRVSTASKLKDDRDKEAWSFAKVIKTSGYFPELGSTVVARAPLPPPLPAWGRAAQPVTGFTAPAPAPSTSDSTGAVLTFGSRRRR